MLSNKITEVKTFFENSLGSTKLFHNGMPFRVIVGKISHLALDMIKSENDRSFKIGLDLLVCDYILRAIYGLPCTH